MASLDHMEGDLVEGAIWLILGIIVLALILAYLGNKSLLNFLAGIESRIASWLKSLLSRSPGIGAFNPSGSGSAWSTFNGPSSPGSDLSVLNGDLTGLLSPLETDLFDVNQFAQDASGGTGNGNDPSGGAEGDQGSSVGASFNGSGTYYTQPVGS